MLGNLKRGLPLNMVFAQSVFLVLLPGGEHRLDSDLDVFVELEEADPFTMFDIRETLESLCGCKVDLLRLRKGLRDLLLKRIEQDGIYI